MYKFEEHLPGPSIFDQFMTSRVLGSDIENQLISISYISVNALAQVVLNRLSNNHIGRKKWPQKGKILGFQVVWGRRKIRDS